MARRRTRPREPNAINSVHFQQIADTHSWEGEKAITIKDGSSFSLFFCLFPFFNPIQMSVSRTRSFYTYSLRAPRTIVYIQKLSRSRILRLCPSLLLLQSASRSPAFQAIDTELNLSSYSLLAYKSNSINRRLHHIASPYLFTVPNISRFNSYDSTLYLFPSPKF